MTRVTGTRAGGRTDERREHRPARTHPGRGPLGLRRTLRLLRPERLQPRLPADRRLVGRRGRDGDDLHGGLATPGEGGPRGGSVRPWLLGVATNVARNHCRGNRRYRAAAVAYAAAGPAEASVPDHASEVAGRIDDRRRIAATLRALGTLRRTEREVLVLCLWEGLAYTEVAQALRVPVGTVRSRLSRARTKLRIGAERELAGEKGEPFPEKREPASRTRQTTGDRVNAVRPAQEGIR